MGMEQGGLHDEGSLDQRLLNLSTDLSAFEEVSSRLLAHHAVDAKASEAMKEVFTETIRAQAEKLNARVNTLSGLLHSENISLSQQATIHQLLNSIMKVRGTFDHVLGKFSSTSKQVQSELDQNIHLLQDKVGALYIRNQAQKLETERQSLVQKRNNIVSLFNTLTSSDLSQDVKDFLVKIDSHASNQQLDHDIASLERHLNDHPELILKLMNTKNPLLRTLSPEILTKPVQTHLEEANRLLGKSVFELEPGDLKKLSNEQKDALTTISRTYYSLVTFLNDTDNKPILDTGKHLFLPLRTGRLAVKQLIAMNSAAAEGKTTVKRSFKQKIASLFSKAGEMKNAPKKSTFGRQAPLNLASWTDITFPELNQSDIQTLTAVVKNKALSRPERKAALKVLIDSTESDFKAIDAQSKRESALLFGFGNTETNKGLNTTFSTTLSANTVFIREEHTQPSIDHFINTLKKLQQSVKENLKGKTIQEDDIANQQMLKKVQTMQRRWQQIIDLLR